MLALWSQPQCSTRLPVEEVSVVAPQLSSECVGIVCDVLARCGPAVQQLLRAGTDTLRALVPHTVPSVLQCVAVDMQVLYSVMLALDSDTSSALPFTLHYLIALLLATEV